MKKIYIIMESIDDYEDYMERKLDAKENRYDADVMLQLLRDNFKIKESKLKEISDTEGECESDDCYECSKKVTCDMQESLFWEVNNHNGYWIDEMNIPEVLGEEFSCKRVK